MILHLEEDQKSNMDGNKIMTMMKLIKWRRLTSKHCMILPQIGKEILTCYHLNYLLLWLLIRKCQMEVQIHQYICVKKNNINNTPFYLFMLPSQNDKKKRLQNN